MKAVKDEFLHALERVQPGLSVIEGVEQGTCFVFKGGHVHAYNKKLYASAPCPCPVEGAVRAKPLLASLRKMVADEIVLSDNGGHLIFNFGRDDEDELDLLQDTQLSLPLEDVDEPDEWRPLHESFSDALALVQECAGADRKKYVCMCVHVHPDFLEAHDGLAQAIRYQFDTGVERPCLVERDTLRHVVASGVSEIGETESWLHFRGSGIRMACRRMLEDYPDISSAFARTKGNWRIWLPASLQELTEFCEVSSSEEKDTNVILVEINDGKMRLTGKGASSRARGNRKCQYDGPPLKFYLTPALLKGLAEKTDSAYVNPEGRLIVDGGEWRMVIATTPVEERQG